MRAFWVTSETAKRLQLASDFWDRNPETCTPPGIFFLENAERLYGLWHVATTAMASGLLIEGRWQIAKGNEGRAVEQPETFQGRSGVGASEAAKSTIVVFFVAMLEAYLKDVLTLAALGDQSLMQRQSTDIRFSSRDLVEAEALEELKERLPRLWAEKWLLTLIAKSSKHENAKLSRTLAQAR